MYNYSLPNCAKLDKVYGYGYFIGLKVFLRLWWRSINQYEIARAASDATACAERM